MRHNDLTDLVRELRQLPAVQEWLAWQHEADQAARRANIAVHMALRHRKLRWFGWSAGLDWLKDEPPEPATKSEPVQSPLALPAEAPEILKGSLGRALLALPRVQAWLAARARLQAAKLAGQDSEAFVYDELAAREAARVAVRPALRRRGCANPFIRDFQLDWLLERRGG